MAETVRVGMAQIGIAMAPDRLETQALGSCAGVVLYDPAAKIGGIAHAMLPSINDAKKDSRDNTAKFVDSGIEGLLDAMIMNGARKERIRAKLCGGANMFKEIFQTPLSGIGQRNTDSAKAKLEELNIPIVAEDIGGSLGRTIVLDTENGKLKVRTVTQGEQVI